MHGQTPEINSILNRIEERVEHGSVSYAFSIGKDFIMKTIRFESKERENFFYSMLKRTGNTDSYHQAFFYCVGISDTTRRNVERIFDFKQGHIRPEGLHEGWQTGGSIRLTRLAFNLWNGYTEKEDERMSTPYEIFDCGYAPYFFEAIRLKYPDYCRELPAMKPQTAQRER